MTTVLATDSARPNTNPPGHDQPSRRANPAPITVAMTIWMIAPGTTMRATAIRSLSEKCRPTPNNSRMDADLGQLAGQRGVGDETGGERADHDPGHHVARQRLDAQPVRQQAEDVCQHQAGGDGGDQRGVGFGHRNSIIDRLFRRYRYLIQGQWRFAW
jgi:hypothetical protein